MTKSEFITLWERIEPIVTKPINGQIAIECDCEFIDYCGGYQLNLRPKCLLWTSELVFILMACDLLCCSAPVSFGEGIIRIC